MTPVRSDLREQEIDRILDEMTLQEKIELVHGADDPKDVGIGYLPPNERFDIPELRFADGPLGVRVGEATAFPASIALAATWNAELAREQGDALGREANAKEIDVLLAPSLNIIRVPVSGRTFECYSEDPHLTSRFAVNTIRGIQAQGTIATAKHYIANNQENNRFEVNAAVSERALREIYLPGFKAAVQEAEVGALMAGYNKVNDEYASQNRALLTELLKEELGFDGFVVSDWWGTQSTVKAANAGLDLEMPSVSVGKLVDAPNVLISLAAHLPGRIAVPADVPNPANTGRFGAPLQQAIEAQQVTHDTLNDKVRRVMRQAMWRAAFVDNRTDADDEALDTAEHRALAQRIATESIVLLKNRNDLLPLEQDSLDSIAVIGPNADTAKVGGGGSSSITPSTSVSPLEGIRREASIPVGFERGVERVSQSAPFGMSQVTLGTGKQDDDSSIERATALARQSSAAIVFAQDDATEGHDRSSLGLPGRQDELIEAVAGANDHTIIVLNTSGPVLMPWSEMVPAVIEAWYPGQEDGSAIASVLFGKTTPTGKLPVTFGERTADYPVTTQRQYPGTNDRAEYTEGVFVGYRHFDTQEIEPLFPFGHGLSYTDFEYTNLRVSPTVLQPNEQVGATVRVQNTGAFAGAEIIQCYICPPQTDIERPVKELVAFDKLQLEPREYRDVQFELSDDALSFYDSDNSEWNVSAGSYEILIGSSSRDIRLRETFKVRKR